MYNTFSVAVHPCVTDTPVFQGESRDLTEPVQDNGSLLFSCLCPSVCASGVELQGQAKPPILCWKEMIIYHLVIHGDRVTRAKGGTAYRDGGREPEERFQR